MGSMIEFTRPDGGGTKGYLAIAGEGRPGVVVIQEWWGLNDQICGVADRFARAGYNALAPDLYKGRVAIAPDEANHLMTGLDFADATHQDLSGAARHLKPHSGKMAAMGYCMGGALTIAAAVQISEFAAGVCKVKVLATREERTVAETELVPSIRALLAGGDAHGSQ